jgi:elongation factor G
MQNAYLEMPDRLRGPASGRPASATVAAGLVPLLCGSSLHNKGIQPLLDAVVDYLPSPLDVPAVQGMTSRRRRLRARDQRLRAAERAGLQDGQRSLRGQAGLCPGVFRRAEKGQPTSSIRARASASGIMRLLRVHANHREEVDEPVCGEIGARWGLKQVTTGDTLCAENSRSCWSASRSPSR